MVVVHRKDSAIRTNLEFGEDDENEMEDSVETAELSGVYADKIGTWKLIAQSNCL